MMGREGSPSGAPNFTPLVDTRVTTPILERRLTGHVLQRRDAVPSGQPISPDVIFHHVGYTMTQIIRLAQPAAW